VTKKWHASQRLLHRHLGIEPRRRLTVRRVVCPWGNTTSYNPPAFSAWPHALSHVSSRAQSRALSQMSGLDVAGLLNRLVDRQHDDFQQAVQREQSVRAEAKAEASQMRAEAYQREKEVRTEAYQRVQAAKLKPIKANKQQRLKLISESKKPGQRPELWRRLKYFSKRSKSEARWRRRWKLIACVESWPRKKLKSASRSSVQ